MTFRHIAITGAVLALTTTACGSGGSSDDPDPRDRINVSGTYGARPTIRIKAPLTVPETTSWTAGVGDDDGDKVGAESTAILSLTIADARTGRTAISTHDPGERPLSISLADQVFPALVKSLVGRSSGTRVVVASTPDDAYAETGAPQLGIKGGDSVVMVADILSTDPTSILAGPTGPSSPPPATAPKLRESNGDPVGFDFRGLRKPRRFAAVVLRKGTGPVIKAPDRIVADHLGEVWGAKEPFDSSYGKEPSKFSIGLGRVVPGWDRGLVGLREGARVLLICPPALGYGAVAKAGVPASSTLVYVVDVLGVG